MSGNNGFSNYFDLSTKPFYPYKLEKVNGKFTWKRNEKTKTTPVKTEKKVQQVGCGTSFAWRDLPKIEEEKILELYKVKIIEQAKN